MDMHSELPYSSVDHTHFIGKCDVGRFGAQDAKKRKAPVTLPKVVYVVV